MAAFTLPQTNRTNRAIAPESVLIEPNMTSVNTHLGLQKINSKSVFLSVLKDVLHTRDC